MTAPKKVLFVCMGNICRSPTAEGVFRHYVSELVSKHVSEQVSELVSEMGPSSIGDDSTGSAGAEALLEIDSAGTSGYHQGEPADPRMRASAAERGYELTSRSRPVTVDDFERFDLIVAMDHDNLRDLESARRAAPGTADVKLLSDFLDDSWPEEVPDPYYGASDGFRFVVEMLEAACPRLAEHLGIETPGEPHETPHP